MILYPFQPDLPFGYSVAGFDEEKKTPGAELYLLPPGAQIPAEFTGGAIFSEAAAPTRASCSPRSRPRRTRPGSGRTRRCRAGRWRGTSGRCWRGGASGCGCTCGRSACASRSPAPPASAKLWARMRPAPCSRSIRPITPPTSSAATASTSMPPASPGSSSSTPPRPAAKSSPSSAPSASRKSSAGSHKRTPPRRRHLVRANTEIQCKKVQPGKSGLHLLFIAVVLRQLVSNLIPPISGGAYQDAREVTIVWNDA